MWKVPPWGRGLTPSPVASVLFHEQHATSFLELAGLKGIVIDSARSLDPTIERAIPLKRIRTWLSIFVHKRRNFLPQHIADNECDVAAPSDGIANGCCRIEGVRIVRMKRKR